MMVFGLREILIILVTVLIWAIPLAVIVVLVRNYLIKRRRRENQELREEIDALKDQVSSLERNRKG